MNGSRLPAIGPDGSPISVPREQLGELEAAHGRVQSPEEAAAQDASIAQQTAEQSKGIADLPGEYADTWLAGAHAAARGTGEAFGVPVDEKAIGIAHALGGEDSAQKTRAALHGLDERHPYASAWMGMVGNVTGAVGAAEMMGNPGAGAGRSAQGIATRMAYGGAENVVQATTKDINEDALGDRKTNANKLVAAMPKHFLIGAVLTGGFEGGAYALEKGAGALRSRVAPKLEAGANRAIGRELGLEGDEALEAGARVRELHGGEVPKSPKALGDTLAGEQAAQRGTAAEAHAAEGAALDATQRAETEGLGAYHGGLRAEAREAGQRGVAEAEREAGAGVAEKVAAREAGVAEAEARAGADLGEAQAGQVRAEGRASAADQALAGIPSEVAAVARSAEEVRGHYASVLEAMRAEHVKAAEAVDIFSRQHAEVTDELRDIIRRIGDGSDGAPGRELARTRAATSRGPTKAELLEYTRGGKIVDGKFVPREGAIKPPPAQGKMGYGMRAADADAAIEAAGKTGSEATLAEAQRLSDLQQQIAASRSQAIEHLQGIEKAATALKAQGTKDVAMVSRATERRVVDIHKKVPAEVMRAQKAAELARQNVSKVEAETRAFVEAARGKGDKAVAVAEKRGAARIESAKADAAAALERAEKIARSESEQLTKAHAAQSAGRGKPSETTTVDALVEGMKKKSAQAAERPLVSPHAALGSVFSLVHGHPLGAAANLLGSFAAGAARNEGNILAARTMLNLSRRISAVDEAVRRGAASVLGHAGAVASEDAEHAVEKRAKGPKFEEVAQSLVDIQANPVELEHRVRESVGHLSDHAPGTYTEMLATAQRAHAYLFSILPIPQRDPHSLTPHLEKGDVPDVDKFEFMQAVQAVGSPLEAFKNTRDGDITENQVAAIQAVYPPLFDQMRAEVRRQSMYLTKPVDYDREIHVGTLLGIVTDEVLEPEFQATMRRSYEDKAAAGAPVGGRASSPDGASKMSKSMTSASQAVEGGTP